MARLARFELGRDGGDPVATVPIPGGAVEVLAGGGFDPAAAERRRREQRDRIEGEIGQVESKLANRGFVDNAPPDVVQAQRDRLARLRAELEEL